MVSTALQPIIVPIEQVEAKSGFIPYQRRTRSTGRGRVETQNSVRQSSPPTMPPARPDRPRAHQQPPAPKAQPPRPPNAWILYRSDKLRELAVNQPPGPRKPQAEISKIISQMWAAEGPETKGMYESRADEKKAEHALLYPGYKFAPMKREDKVQMRRAIRLEKEEVKQAERNRARKRKGKGRADDEDDDSYEAPSRPFITAPTTSLPYPLSANTTPTQGLQQPRPAQAWYPASTYGPQQSHQYPQHHPSPPQPSLHPHTQRLPPPPLASHLQPTTSGSRTSSGSSAFAAAGWSAAVDPEAPPHADAPFNVGAYRQAHEADDAEEEEPAVWEGEEQELEAWHGHGRSRRGAVWDEEQVPRQQQYPNQQYSGQYAYSQQEGGYQGSYPQQQQQQEDPLSAWTSIENHPSTPPPQPHASSSHHPQQPPSLTITLDATLGPSDSDPYTFNLDFDMPMAAYNVDPDANVAISLAQVNIGEHSSATAGPGLLSGVGQYGVPGLNDLLEAPLPDIDVSFAPYMFGGNGEGHVQQQEGGVGAAGPGFDVLNGENEEWWAALMDVALMGGEGQPQQQQYTRHEQEEQGEDRASPERAFKGTDGGVMLAPQPRRQSQDAHSIVAHLALDSSAPGPSTSTSAPSTSSGSAPSTSRGPRPTPVHAHTAPSFAHGLPSPEPFVPAENFDSHAHANGGRSRAGSSAYPPPTQYHPHPDQQDEREPYVQPFAQIASAPTNRRTGGSWRPQPPPPPPPVQGGRKQAPGLGIGRVPGAFPSPSGAGAFPSPSGANVFPSPSGGPAHQPRGFPNSSFPATPQTVGTSSPQQTAYYPPPPHHQSAPVRQQQAPPPPPFFNTRKGKEEVKGKDSEAFDFSGWGSQYAGQQPPTPAEDTVRRGCVGAVTH